MGCAVAVVVVVDVVVVVVVVVLVVAVVLKGDVCENEIYSQLIRATSC